MHQLTTIYYSLKVDLHVDEDEENGTFVAFSAHQFPLRNTGRKEGMDCCEFNYINMMVKERQS